MNELVKFWREFRDGGENCLHPEDRRFFRFCLNPPPDDPKHTHLNMLPAPYRGHLETADIFVCFLNPGFNPKDREYAIDPEFRQLRLNTLYQENWSSEYRVDLFNPELSEHPGHQWLSSHFGELFTKELSDRLAILQAYPYNSNKFGNWAFQRNLPSVKQMRSFVQGSLVPRARHGEVLLIVARGARLLGFDTEYSCEINLLIYGGGERRGAFMTPATRGGKKIMHRLRDDRSIEVNILEETP